MAYIISQPRHQVINSGILDEKHEITVVQKEISKKNHDRGLNFKKF